MTDIQTFLNQIADLSPEQMEPLLKEKLNLQLDSPIGHLEWARVADELGCSGLAFREAQLAVKFQPEAPEALLLLAQMFHERGRTERAGVHIETLLKLQPEHAQALALKAELETEKGPEQVAISTLALAEESVSAPDDYQAFRFLQAFAGREDTYARQWYTREQHRGGYTPVMAPLTPREIRNHLLGNETLGVYCLRLDNTVNFMAVDLDITKSSLEAARTDPARAALIRHQLRETAQILQTQLQELGLPSILENSGFKGRHLWVLFAEPQPAAVALVFGQLFLRMMTPNLPADFHLEFFPKQAETGNKGLGNLIKLPLGIHRRSGRRSVFLDNEGQTLERAHEYLEQHPRVSGDTLFAAIEALKALNLPVLFPVKKGEVRPQLPLGPAPPPTGPSWTEADFENSQPIRHLFHSCPVLRALRLKVEEHRQLSLDEQLTLMHTLGHLPEGVLAVNYLFSRCGNIAPQNYLQSVLKGNPVSCGKIRQRIPQITARVACNCDFSFAQETYPSPVRHLHTLPESQPTEAAKASHTPESLARRYALLEKRIAELQGEKEALGQALREHLLRQENPVLILPEGQYRLERSDEVEELRWEPAEGA